MTLNLPQAAMLVRARPAVARLVERALEHGGAALTAEDGATLLRARGARDLCSIFAAADAARRAAPCGERVTYVVNRNINFTNACVKRCGFCAFSRTGIDDEAYFLGEAEVVRRAIEAARYGATEVCVQAGLPGHEPTTGRRFDGALYPRLAAAIRDGVAAAQARWRAGGAAADGRNATTPLAIHAFSPEEVVHGAAAARESIPAYVRRLRESGVTSLPGTSAEILDDGVRRSLARGRLSVARWFEVVGAAHDAGLPTSATLMYGHIEAPEHVARHLTQLRDHQLRRGAERARYGGGGVAGGGDAPAGFTEIVPLSFVAAEAPLWRDRATRERLRARSGPEGVEVLLVHAVARLLLHGAIHNVQVSWPKEGERLAQAAVALAGANDVRCTRALDPLLSHADASRLPTTSQVGGVLMNESISTAAGARHGQRVAPSALRRLIRGADPANVPVQRAGPDYSPLRVFESDDALRADDEDDADADARYDGALAREAAADSALEALLLNGEGEGAAASGSAAAELFGSYETLIADPRVPRARDSRRRATEAGRRRALHSAAAAVVPRGDAVIPDAPPTRKAVTVSACYTLVPTFECYNACGYCNFRSGPPRGDAARWLSVDDAVARLRARLAEGAAIVEVLVIAGEVHPTANPALRAAWHRRAIELCEAVLDLGLLPHTNIGPLSEREMAALAAVNASMGLMLETLRDDLPAHRGAPSKAPRVRLAQLEQAGRLGVPFTTGLLLGVGEGADDRARALDAISAAHARHGHVQEVILQPHSRGTREQERAALLTARRAAKGKSNSASSSGRFELAAPTFALDELPALVAAAREALPPEVAIQVPPNLARPVLRACLDAGASDLGGVSPRDEVNPDFSFDSLPELGDALRAWGYELTPRLPTHARHWGAMPPRVREVARGVSLPVW